GSGPSVVHRLSPPPPLVDLAPGPRGPGAFFMRELLSRAVYHVRLHEKAPAARRLPEEDPHGARVRRRAGVAARAREEPVAPPAQQGAAQARGPAARLLVQAARRLQQDGSPGARAAQARRDLRV